MNKTLTATEQRMVTSLVAASAELLEDPRFDGNPHLRAINATEVAARQLGFPHASASWWNASAERSAQSLASAYVSNLLDA
jgi:hypothetical protein